MIGEWSKLTQREYKTQYNWVRKVIHWEFCKKLKFDYTTKYYKHKPESVLKNESHKFLWYFEIQTDHIIPVKRPAQEIINKKKKKDFSCNEFCRLGRQQIKNAKRDKFLDPFRELKKLWNMSNGDTNSNCCS